MEPQNKFDERTEVIPAQEKVASSAETALPLSAEEVYAQRFAGQSANEHDHIQGFVP